MDAKNDSLITLTSDSDRLVRLENELAVRQLIDRYAHACDTIDPGGVAALFDEHGVLIVGATKHTGVDILGFYTQRLHDSSLHFTTGLTISPRPDGCFDATCGFLAISFTDSSQRVSMGRYTDVVRVANGAARFVSRQIELQRRI